LNKSILVENLDLEVQNPRTTDLSHRAAQQLGEELAHYLYLRIDELFNTETDDGSPQEVASLCVLVKMESGPLGLR